MGSEHDIAELKRLMIDVSTTVKTFDSKLDSVELKLTRMVNEVRSEVKTVKGAVETTQREVKDLRGDHDELERGVQHIEYQLNALEVGKMELLRQSLESKIGTLNEKLVMLEKHQRKYNVLVYGVPQNKDENIVETMRSFMTTDLDISSAKVVSIPIANVHRIPSKKERKHNEPDPIIIRFVHFSDKKLVMSKGFKLAGKRMRILDGLPVVMKTMRNELAGIAYNIRKEEKLQTRIRDVGTHMYLETRLNSKDAWQLRKDFHAY